MLCTRVCYTPALLSVHDLKIVSPGELARIPHRPSYAFAAQRRDHFCFGDGSHVFSSPGSNRRSEP
eukprot:SAG31_NODE_1618_length_7732_cov_28.468361_7_plen_66_part_00